MGPEEAREIALVCPCCGARLKIDAELGRVIGHEAPPRRKPSRSLDRAGELLEKEAARREAHFRESKAEEKIKAELLQRKFEEALKKSRNEPAGPTLRDIDLD